MNTISSISNVNAYTPQIVNKVAEANSANLANNAANQSSFSSYIGQALAQIGVANPTNASAPVVSGSNNANKNNASEKSLSTFIQDLFEILSGKDSSGQRPISVPTSTSDQRAFYQDPNPNIVRINADEADAVVNDAAIAAYNAENTTTVGNIVGNLQTLVAQLNDTSRNTSSDNTSVIQSLKNGFQSISDAQGTGTNSSSTLGDFLQALAQNLQGQSPVGVIFNAQA